MNDKKAPMRNMGDGNFASDLFENADPAVAGFMARYNALLERVAVLERALEELAETGRRNYTDPLVMRMGAAAQRALDA